MSYAVWGWGGPSDEPTDTSLDELAPFVAETTGLPVGRVCPLSLPDPPAPRRAVPASLQHLASTDSTDRVRHGTGRATRDLLRVLSGVLPGVPDLVLRPRSEQDVVDVLDWATAVGAPVIPYGGGTSVVGGVEPRGLDAAVSVDLQHVSGLLEVDPTSRSVRLGAGTLGPDAEAALRPHGLTLRFYPQSFERSTVGGWVATRAAGHFSTGPTHVDDLVQSVRAVTPVGLWESRRLPASGAGPSPDRLLLGSEGVLGVVTSTWLRAQPRPVHRWPATLAAPSFATGAAAVRALVQSGLQPATCRLLDPVEARLSGTLLTGEAALVLGLESLGPPIDTAWPLDLLRDCGLRVLEQGDRGEAGGAWRSTFLRAPYLRESLLLLGILVETFETACTWDRLDALVGAVTAALGDVVVGVRLTHAYRDGAAPYFTVLTPGAGVAEWDELKARASEALLSAGGTITHHHAVGRDHRPWYDAQRPEPFAAALRATKRALDPSGVLNPGVLV